jgi:DNA primase
VATLGTATTPLHVQKLLRQADEIVFSFDGDSAGRRAAWRALENSLAQLQDGKQLKFLFLPDGEDPDTYVRKHGKEAFEKALSASVPLSRFLLDELSSKGLLSNERFAHALVAQKSGSYSRRSIRSELKRKGVSGEAIEGAIGDATIDDDAAMLALWQRRFGAPPANDREKARQIRFLQSRGFALSAIFKMLKTLAR